MARSRLRASAARISARSAPDPRNPAPGSWTPWRSFGPPGIPTEAPSDIRTVLWSKACNAAGVFGVTSVLRISTPRLFRDPHLIRAYLGLVRETAAIAAAHGVPVDDFTNFPIRTYVTRPDEETVAALSQKAFLAPAATGGVESFASMTQDLRAGRAIEVDDVFADLVERGERAGVAVPRLRLVRDFLRGLDPGHQAELTQEHSLPASRPLDGSPERPTPRWHRRAATPRRRRGAGRRHHRHRRHHRSPASRQARPRSSISKGGRSCPVSSTATST